MYFSSVHAPYPYPISNYYNIIPNLNKKLHAELEKF